MKPISYSVLLIILGLLSCSEFHQLTPPNPVIGQWRLSTTQFSDLPDWFKKYTGDSMVISPTLTTYFSPQLAFLGNVFLYKFNADGTFNEFYYQDGGVPNLSKMKSDTGTWVLRDSIVTLSVVNPYPHKLTYSVASGQLATDRFRETSIIGLDEKIDTVSYSAKIFYFKEK